MTVLRRMLLPLATAAAALALVALPWARPAGAAGSPAEVRQVLDRLASGDFPGARAAAGRDPAMAAYVEWRDLRDGPAETFGTYRAFLEAHPGWPDRARLQTRAEEALPAYGTAPDEVRRFFAARPARTERGREAHLAALVASGDVAGAPALARRIWVEDDFAPPEERAFLDRHGGHLAAADHAARLDRLLWDGRTGDAERLLPLVPVDRQAVALARLRLQQGSKAAEASLRAVPAEGLADPGLAWDRLRWRKARGDTGGVEEILVSVTAEPVKPAAWWAERGRLARDAMEAGQHARAYRLASTHKLPDGSEHAEAEWFAGWLALRALGDPARAEGHFARFGRVVATPISKARGLYWSGRARAAQGDTTGALRLYGEAARHPTAFYGQLAARELGRPVRVAAAAPPPDERARAAFRRNEVADVAEALCAAGAQAQAAPLVRQLGADAGKAPAALELVYDLARRCARPDLLVVVAKAAVQAGAEPLPTYPVPDVASMLSPAAGRPEPALILSIARQESQFDPGVASKAGARGLMQLMPTTARSVANTLGTPFDLEALTADPDLNVQLGSWYLARQLQVYGGSVPLAAAAYNAGPGRVNEWLGRFGDPRGGTTHELVDWIERIPFAETRNYVQRVMEGHAVYAALLEGGDGRLVPLAGARLGTAALRRAGGDGG